MKHRSAFTIVITELLGILGLGAGLLGLVLGLEWLVV
jgi:hypothetical protein